MRSFLLVVCFFLFCANLFSQKNYSKKKLRQHSLKVYESKNKSNVVLSLDTIFNKGISYAILKEKKQIPYTVYALYSISNNPLMHIETKISINQQNTPFYAFMFVESEQVAEVEKYYGLKIEKVIVDAGLVSNHQIDRYQETKFLLKFPRKFSDTTVKTYISDRSMDEQVNTANIYETVERNREATVVFNEGKIMQDYKIIGKYKIIDTIIRFYLPNGIFVAEATENENEGDAWNLWSMKERRNHFVRAGTDVLNNLIQYLIKHQYL